MPPPKKPLFKPPSKPSKPEPQGRSPGWLLAQGSEESTANKTAISMDPTEGSPREPGWLLAESLQNTKVLDPRPGFGSQEVLEGRSSSGEKRSQSSQQEK